MRIGLRQAWTRRLRANLYSSSSSSICFFLHQSCKCHGIRHINLYSTVRPFHSLLRRGSQVQNTLQTSRIDSSTSRREDSLRQEAARSDGQVTTRTYQIKPAIKDRKSVDAWVLLLEYFLPQDLQLNHVVVDFAGPRDLEDVIKILAGARSSANTGVDLLTHMAINQGRHKAVLYLVESLLRAIADDIGSVNEDEHPSNIQWPDDFTLSGPENIKLLGSISINQRTPRKSIADEYCSTSTLDVTSQAKTRKMEQIWLSLGKMIVEAANLSGENAPKAMSIVYKILAHIHNLNLLPGTVYSYAPTRYSCTVQRPPILHLLSSRILTTLSDAVWRSHQDEVISRVVGLGVPYKDIGLDPPGGRFRLKVRDLGPEIWLEFVLWCCVEGGFASAGARIIDSLNHQIGEPWFAIHWTTTGNTEGATTSIDWDRIKLRHGGTVGLIEGYSREKPFVEMPPRTISAEVVLALIEGLLSSAYVGVRNRGILLGRVRKDIRNLVSFLEPHGLHVEYFDYITVRLLQMDTINVDLHPEALNEWSETMTNLRHLEIIESKEPTMVGFAYDNVIAHSELQAGILHQVLDGYISACDIGQSLEAFAKIQHLVDSSKLQAIGVFLNSVPGPDEFFSSRPTFQNVDFTSSHGQLPLYKIAALLNLVTDNNLVRLGEWLMYTEDVDGPLVPRSAYRNPCIATALIRFASTNEDKVGLQHIIAHQKNSKLKPSVNFLRALVNAQVCLHNFDKAASVLRQLRNAQGGGYGFGNVANLAATILRLEIDSVRPPSASAKSLAEAKALMNRILHGDFDSTRGDFYRSQKRIFKQQIGHLLRLFDNLLSNTLSDIAFLHRTRFPTSNEASLTPSAFNVILAAIVDTKGSAEGKRLWDLFCQDPRLSSTSTSVSFPGDYIVVPETNLEDGEFEGYSVPHSEMQGISHADEYLPTVAINPVNSESRPKLSTLTSVSSQENYEGSYARSAVPSSADITFDVDISEARADPLKLSLQDDSPLPTDTASEPNPLVIPDMRTLRIIVQGALAEKRISQGKGAEAAKRSRDNAKTITRWATHLYKALGSSRECIEQEIQEPLTESDEISSLEETQMRDERDRRRLGVREQSPIDLQTYFRPWVKARMSPVENA